MKYSIDNGIEDPNHFVHVKLVVENPRNSFTTEADVMRTSTIYFCLRLDRRDKEKKMAFFLKTMIIY